MYTKLIKFVLLLSLVLLSGFAGRVLYSPLLNRASQGRDPRHTESIRHFTVFSPGITSVNGCASSRTEWRVIQ